jgi:hypothetical protein
MADKRKDAEEEDPWISRIERSGCFKEYQAVQVI